MVPGNDGWTQVTETGLIDVTVVRGGTAALRNVTLLADPGELLVVLGPSGSGKSTVLRAIAGLTPLQQGEVYIGGRRVTNVPTQHRRIAMIFESAALVPFLDVAENMAWGLRAQHTPKDEITERVSARARELRLTRLLRRKPKELSVGERGVVGVGRALVRSPDVFLMDEPLAHLDPAERSRIRRQIVETVQSLGVTTFYVTHDQSEALAIADQVALLKDGALAQRGTPTEIYERPVDLFVAGFVGAMPMGLLPARLVVSAGSAGFQVGARTLPLWAPIPTPLADRVGQEVLLGLRAVDVFDADRHYQPELATLSATLTEVEYTGQHNLVTAAVPVPPVTTPEATLSVSSPSAAHLYARFPPRAVVARGSRVELAIDMARAHVFDAATGRALWHPPRLGEVGPP
jgi:multiple sugar transport system ATP-binding protein